MKKTIYITGSRAEYGVMKALLIAMQQSSAFEVSLIVTGMHLSHEHGHTVDEIKKSGLRISAEVDMHVEDSTNAGMARAIGHAIIGITDVLVRENPDFLMVTGDRGEALAGAIAASHLNIPVVHISGGDTTTGATIDERIRHAVTKFSDIHFPANEHSAAVIVSMGGNKELVFPVGNPGVAATYTIQVKEKEAVAKKFRLDRAQPILLCIQHPTTSGSSDSARQMRETLEALKGLAMQTVVIYPNSDAGSKEMIGVIGEYANVQHFRINKHIEREDFLRLMSIAGVIVGNSSAALIEAPSFGLPAVNIGPRQEGRERGINVIDASHITAEIISAIQKALSPEFKKSLANMHNPYSGDAADERIISILKELGFSSPLLTKEKYPHVS